MTQWRRLQKQSGRICIGMLAVLVMSSAAAQTGVPSPVLQRRGRYQVTRLRAFLYYHESGTFSKANILTGKVPLRNIIIGEGEDESPSDSMLLLVDVQGPGFMTTPLSLALKVTARTKTAELASVRLLVSDFRSEAGRISIPVLVYGNRCEPVHVTATLEPSAGQPEVTAVAPFSCGE